MTCKIYTGRWIIGTNKIMCRSVDYFTEASHRTCHYHRLIIDSACAAPSKINKVDGGSQRVSKDSAINRPPRTLPVGREVLIAQALREHPSSRHRPCLQLSSPRTTSLMPGGDICKSCELTQIPGARLIEMPISTNRAPEICTATPIRPRSAFSACIFDTSDNRRFTNTRRVFSQPASSES